MTNIVRVKGFYSPNHIDSSSDQALCFFQNILYVLTRGKGQKYLDAADQWWSSAVSRVRQPIESLFNWIEEKTEIQRASKVRSSNGLLFMYLAALPLRYGYWLRLKALNSHW